MMLLTPITPDEQFQEETSRADDNSEEAPQNVSHLQSSDQSKNRLGVVTPLQEDEIKTIEACVDEEDEQIGDEQLEEEKQQMMTAKKVKKKKKFVPQGYKSGITPYEPLKIQKYQQSVAKLANKQNFGKTLQSTKQLFSRCQTTSPGVKKQQPVITGSPKVSGKTE